MNQADTDRIQELCSLIAVEQDRQKFLSLVEELNGILAAKNDRLHHKDKEPHERPHEHSGERPNERKTD